MWSVIPDTPPTREQLQGLGLVVAVAAAVAAGGLALLAGLSWPWVLAGAAAVAFVGSAAARRRPDRLRPLHHVWRRAASAYARRARRAVLAICYHAVVVAAGRSETRLRLRPSRRDESQWTPRATLPADEYGGQGGGLRSARTTASGDLRAWARAAGQPWALFLVPFLLLLAAFDPHDEPGSPESIYTLY